MYLETLKGLSMIIPIIGLMVIAYGRMDQVACRTRCDAQIPILTTADYVRTMRLSRLKFGFGFAIFIAGIQLMLAYAPGDLPGSLLIGLITYVGFLVVQQWRVRKATPVRAEELHDDNVHTAESREYIRRRNLGLE